MEEAIAVADLHTGPGAHPNVLAVGERIAHPTIIPYRLIGLIVDGEISG